MIASRYQPLLRYLAELVAAEIIAGNILDSDSEPQHNVNHGTSSGHLRTILNGQAARDLDRGSSARLPGAR